jgi:hypothetical protein
MQCPNYQENRTVTISAEHLNSIRSYYTTESPQRTRLQQLIDDGAIYVAQNLTSSQFTTLQAIASRIFKRHNSRQLAANLDAGLATSAREVLPCAAPRPISVDYQLGLDELDTIARTRTGYAFAELPTEIQDAILGLIATRDLTTRKLDLALWLEEFHSNAAAL